MTIAFEEFYVVMIHFSFVRGGIVFLLIVDKLVCRFKIKNWGKEFCSYSDELTAHFL